MTCEQLAEKLLETPDLNVQLDLHQGLCRSVDRVTVEELWNNKLKDTYAVIHCRL